MRFTRFQRWALLTTAATYALIAVGGFVRAAGAGLGCPDWPKCFGTWVPPTRVEELPAGWDPAMFNPVKTWIEYGNRMVGVLVGFLILGTLILAIRHHRKQPKILWSSAAAFVLVLFEGWLGGQVVASDLEPFVLSAHMAFALVIVGLLLYATVLAFFTDAPPLVLSVARRKLGLATWTVGILALVQVAIGAGVRGEIQVAARAVPAIPRSAWVASAGMVYRSHAAFAVVVLIAVVALVAYVKKQDEGGWLLRSAHGALLFTIIQIVGGLVLHRLALPPAWQVIHLWSGSLVVGALTALGLLAYRWVPKDLENYRATSSAMSEDTGNTPSVSATRAK